MKAPPSMSQVLLLPFTPALWRAARDWSLAPILAAIAVVALVSTGLNGVWSAIETVSTMRAESQGWDATWDPIVVENGVLRVEGSRVYRSADGRVVVDPEDQVDLEALDDRAIVFRSKELVQVRALDRRVYPYQDLMQTFGMDTLRVDGASLDGFIEGTGLLIVAGVVIVVSLLIATAYGIGVAILAVAAAGLLGLASTGLPFAARARVTLAIGALLPALWMVLTRAGASTSCCVDVFVGVPVLAGAAWLVLRREG